MWIALVSSKGGAGKSALAISLAAEAVARGRNVLLVDADHPQGTCLTWAQAASDAGKPAPTTVAMAANMHRQEQLPKVAGAYDWVVIDTPGRLSDVQRSALMVADVALVPAGPSASDTWALAPTLSLIREAQGLRPELRAAIVLNRAMPRTAIGKAVREGLRNTGLPVLATEVTQRVAYMECVAVGQGVTTYAPSSPAAAEIRALYDETETLGGARGQKTARAQAHAGAARR